MTGIFAGTAAIVGGALGWWGWLFLLATVAILALVAGRNAPILASIFVLFIGLLGAWRHETSDAFSVTFSGTVDHASGVVISDPVRTSRYQRFIIKLETAEDRDGRAEAGRTCVSGDALPVVGLGDQLSITGNVQWIQDVPVGARRFLESRRCVGSIFAESIAIVGMSDPGPAGAVAALRARLGAVLRAAAPGDAGVLLSGLVTGDDAAFSEKRQAAFVRTGTTHLTAVSGSNLALIVGILATLGTATLGRHRLFWQIVTVGGIWAYAIVSGAHSPVVRAAIVATAAVLAFRAGRRPDYPTLILLAAGTMVLIEPAQVDSLGFRLSVASSLALAVTLPRIVQRGQHSVVASAVMATVAAQIATLPILLPVFGTVSLLSVPANVLVAPLIVLAMPLAACAGLSGLVSSSVAEVIAAPAALAAKGTLAIVDVLGTPAAYIGLGTPPFAATAALAVSCGGILALLSIDTANGSGRAWRAHWSETWSRWMPSGRIPRTSRSGVVITGHERGSESQEARD